MRVLTVLKEALEERPAAWLLQVDLTAGRTSAYTEREREREAVQEDLEAEGHARCTS